MINNKFLYPLLFSLSFFSVPAYSGWLGPENYEECVLEKMKGQIKSMRFIAQKACEKKFPFEKELFISGEDTIKTSWSTSKKGIFISVLSNNTGYKVTSIKYSFSKKDCKTSQYSDFTASQNFNFTNQTVNSTPIIIKDGDNYKCGKILSARGIIY